MSTVSLNAEQRLFIIPAGNGYISCLGFDVCHDWTTRIANELGRSDLLPTETGTLEAYAQYRKASDAAQVSQKAGKTLKCMLTPQLIGYEGKRVEVVHQDGEKRWFQVGRSTGWLPIHIELHNSRSSGGQPVWGAPFKSVREV